MIKSSERYSSKNMCNNSFILHRLLIIIRDLNALDESRCKLKTYLQNSIIKLLSYLYSYFLILSISQLVSLLSSKNQFSITREVNLKIKEFNCGKAGFRAIHTENDADMFVLWHCIINGATEYLTHP